MRKLRKDPLVKLYARIRPNLEENHEFVFGHVDFEVLWGYIAVESK